MKRFCWVLVLCCVHFNVVLAQAPSSFTHPGAMNSKADLDFVKSKVKAGEQPWASSFTRVQSLARSGAKPINLHQFE